MLRSTKVAREVFRLHRSPISRIHSSFMVKRHIWWNYTYANPYAEKAPLKYEKKRKGTRANALSNIIVFGATLYFGSRGVYEIMFNKGATWLLLSQSFEAVRDHELVVDALGPNLHVGTEHPLALETKHTFNDKHADMEEIQRDGKRFRFLKYNIVSQQGKRAYVYALMQQDGDLNKWDTYCVTVKVPGSQPIHIVDRRPI